MTFACSPDKGMFVLVPVVSGAIAGGFHLVPILKAPTGKRQRMMNLPPGLNQIQVGRFDGLQASTRARNSVKLAMVRRV